jgi:hypothetical protein
MLFDGKVLIIIEKVNKNYQLPVIPQLWVQVIQMYPYTPLWPPAHRASGPEGKEGYKGRFSQDNFKIPLYPPKL